MKIPIHALIRFLLVKTTCRIAAPMSKTGSWMSRTDRNGSAIAVAGRNGTVLSWKTILKQDHFNVQLMNNKDPVLVGAPNFRRAEGKCQVYGVAQPSASGYRTVLKHLLQERERETNQPDPLLWINMREEPFVYLNDAPFVLRDVDSPFQNLKAFTGVDWERLETVEERLVLDVQEESSRNGGLLRVHIEGPRGELRTALVTVDSVATPRQIFERATDGLSSSVHIRYRRVPVSSFQYEFAEDEFLDHFIRFSTQLPPESSVVLSCGMGMGRTTLGMIVCYLIKSCQRDKYVSQVKQRPTELALLVQLVKLLERVGNEDGALLRNALFDCLDKQCEPCELMSGFEEALLGNYTIIRNLCRALENGPSCKQFLDEAIDACGTMLNLRESILFQRIKAYENDEAPGARSCLNVALRSMERYFLLVAFTSYLLEGNLSGSVLFSRWIKERRELCNIFRNIHKTPPLQLFHPLTDLEPVWKQKGKIFNVPSRTKQNAPLEEFEYLDEHIEQCKFVLKERNGAVLTQGTILKYDTYAEVNADYNLRQVGNIVGIAQPSAEAISHVLRLNKNSGSDGIVWINLREEPIIYLNGSPYVLRDAQSWLRNIKTYSGISAGRIESMEARLKLDILEEIARYEGKLLLHSESQDGQLITHWETIQAVDTPREIFDTERLLYYRVPMTAEVAPEKRFFDHMLRVLRKHGPSYTYVLNCQLGKGRSTTGMIVVRQCLDLLQGTRDTLQGAGSTPWYKTVLSLVRSVPNGLEIKNRIDYLIDQFCQTVHLTGRIEECRTKFLSKTSSLGDSQFYLLKGVESLKRYYFLFAFEAYLDQIQAGNYENGFNDWMNAHLELKKIILEIGHVQPLSSCLIPQSLMQPGEIMGTTEAEIMQLINNRTGSVLAHQMILKHDHFLGCQKMTLPDRIDGAPNFRQVPVDFVDSKTRYLVCGIGMPKEQAVINLVAKLGTEKNILWTSFREEPVLFIKGEPFVLRYFQEPLANIESTGITRERVESIEDRLKQDVLRELQQFNGRILLHEEQVGGSSLGFSITYRWQEATSEDVKTSKEIYQDAVRQFPRLTYRRIPITDEQAPLPSVLDELYNLIVSKNRIGPQGDPVNLVFNCQMGRGRTTTGMVIATIIEICRDVNRVVGLDVSSQINRMNLQGESEETRFRKGEYKIILQLISTLQHGKVAKVVADRAIDQCNHMQNLREAIYTEFYVKLPTVSKATPAYSELRERAINYLMRYFALVVFADYSLSKDERPFSEWLKERKEIVHLHQNRHEFVVEL